MRIAQRKTGFTSPQLERRPKTMHSGLRVLLCSAPICAPPGLDAPRRLLRSVRRGAGGGRWTRALRPSLQRACPQGQSCGYASPAAVPRIPLLASVSVRPPEPALQRSPRPLYSCRSPHCRPVRGLSLSRSTGAVTLSLSLTIQSQQTT